MGEGVLFSSGTPPWLRWRLLGLVSFQSGIGRKDFYLPSKVGGIILGNHLDGGIANGYFLSRKIRPIFSEIFQLLALPEFGLIGESSPR